MELKNKFALLEAIPEDIDMEGKWKNFDEVFNQTAKEVIGVKKKESKTMDRTRILEKGWREKTSQNQNWKYQVYQN